MRAKYVLRPKAKYRSWIVHKNVVFLSNQVFSRIAIRFVFDKPISIDTSRYFFRVRLRSRDITALQQKLFQNYHSIVWNIHCTPVTSWTSKWPHWYSSRSEIWKVFFQIIALIIDSSQYYPLKVPIVTEQRVVIQQLTCIMCVKSAAYARQLNDSQTHTKGNVAT